MGRTIKQMPEELKISVRYGNIEFSPSLFLSEVRQQEGMYSVDKWEKNPYYKMEDKYEWEGDKAIAYRDDYGRPFGFIDKSCFKSKETRYSIASVDMSDINDFIIVERGDYVIKLSEKELLEYAKTVDEGIRKVIEAHKELYGTEEDF